MISTQKKKYLIFKGAVIISVTLIIVSIVRVTSIHYDVLDANMIYMLIAKEICFSIATSIFVISMLYIIMRKELFAINNKVIKYAFTDGLTGLRNRHYLNDFLKKFSSLRKEDAKFAILFIDIDKFKEVNDRLGHSTGDCILKKLANQLESLVRPKDFLCRYGGEEFVIIFSDISKEQVLKKAQQIRVSVQDMCFKCKQESITISVGLSLGKTGDDINRVMEEADKALYMAKDAGRNCVKVFNSQYEG